MIKSRRLSWAGYVATMKESKCTFKIVIGDLAGKRPLGRPRRGWEDKIRMYLKEIGVYMGNWVDSDQDKDYRRALINAALNFLVS